MLNRDYLGGIEMELETPYYVTHPNLPVTAVVYAPSTEKARTTFLDWLERNGHMNRSNRQALRRNMVAERLEDGNVQSDVVLHYGYKTGGPPMEEVFKGQPIAQGGPTDVEENWEGLYPLEEQEPIEFEVPKVIEEKGPTMPIQKVMLRGFR